MGREVLLVDKPSAGSTAISIGFSIDGRRGQDDYAALKLIEAYFGQHRTFSGVLQKSLRVKRGFNYGNYAYCEHFVQEGWQRIPATNISRRQQYFSIWIRPVKDADKHFALRLALRELERLVADGISAVDFEKTRTFVKRYYRTFNQTEQRQLGFALDDAYYGDETAYFEKLFADIDALTVDDVNAAVRKYLTADDLFVAAVTKDAAGFKEALAANAPSPVTYASPKPEEVVAEDEQVKVLELGIPADSIEIIGVDKIFE
jgi:zinc protease